MAATQQKFQTYAAFWPFYLGQHGKRPTRLAHVTGTFLAVVMVMTGILSLDWIFLPLAPVVGYGAAWIAHSLIEKNRPATFTHPLWSLRGDFHMAWLWLTGRLEAELIRHGILT